MNLGIGNNRVTLPGGFGYVARKRFDHDILGQSGILSVVIFEGVNDIAASKGNGETVHLISEPGTKWEYSGGGYTLAQLLLEEKTKGGIE